MVDVPLADTPGGVDTDAWKQACAAVRTVCGWHVAPAVDDTLVIDGSGSQFAMLPTLHVNTLTEVREDGTVLDATTYEWSVSGQLWRYQPWTGHFRALAVDLNHGLAECPEEIVNLLLEAADRGSGSAISQVGQVRAGGVAGTPGAVAFMQDRLDVLAKYKINPRP